MKVPRIFKFRNYETIDIKEYLSKNLVEIHLKKKERAKSICRRCHKELELGYGGYKMRVQHLSVTGHHCYLVFMRYQGMCSSCKKVRSEAVDFLSPESPHKSLEYAWWLGRLCEVGPVSQVSALMKESSSTVWRLDFSRMRRMASHYKIPKVEKICVDEVYVRRKRKGKETRDDLFFTVICDLKTRRVIWVSSSRRKEALDEFFMLIGQKQCSKIKAVACDLHRGYALSVKSYCPQATIVWDRFHVMQIFDEAVNEERKSLHEACESGSEEKRLSRGKFRFMFLKKASRRTKEEEVHIEDLLKENRHFLKLELIKEAMHSFFRAKNKEEAKEIFTSIGVWVRQSRFRVLQRWWYEMNRNWETLKNYFMYRLTTSLSEGMNNVIKTLKRKGYGYRNMQYFKLQYFKLMVWTLAPFSGLQ